MPDSWAGEICVGLCLGLTNAPSGKSSGRRSVLEPTLLPLEMSSARRVFAWICDCAALRVSGGSHILSVSFISCSSICLFVFAKYILCVG